MASVSVLGCGWLGLPLAIRLLNLGFEVKGSTTSEEKVKVLSDFGIDAISLKLDFLQRLSNLSFFSSDYIVITIPFLRSYQDPFDYVRLMDYVLSLIPHATQIVFTSSTSIYPTQDGQFDEFSKLDFFSDRQRALFAVEALVLERNGLVLRLGGLYGPERFIRYREPSTVPINVIHQDDAVGILVSLIKSSVQSRVFNGVSDDHRTKAQLFGIESTNEQILGKIVLNNRVKDELGYVFQYPFVHSFLA